MAIKVLPEGVAAGFEVRGINDSSGQLHQTAFKLSKCLPCSTCQFW